MKLLTLASLIILAPVLASAQVPAPNTPEPTTTKAAPVEPVLAKDHSGPGRVGLRLGTDKDTGLPIIIALTRGGPAEDFGFKVGDIIMRIDKNMTSTLTVDEISLALHGAAGSSVELAVMRNDDPHYIVRALSRRIIPPGSIDSINPPTLGVYKGN